MAIQQEAHVITHRYRLSFGAPLSAQAFDVLWIEPMNMEYVKLRAALQRSLMVDEPTLPIWYTSMGGDELATARRILNRYQKGLNSRRRNIIGIKVIR